jgi:DNA-binding response OmpR family regulator
MKILIVEDEKEILDYLKKGLSSQAFVVDTAQDGEQGLYLAQKGNYDLMVLDNMMPKKSGIEVCESLRAEGNNIPIIILSVKADTDMKVKMLNAGADDYLTKPFSLEELLARIKALLRRPKKLVGDILNIDNLSLDLKKRKAERGGKDIYLRKKEFLLLEYFLKNPGTVLSRSMIMDHVWDTNVDIFSNTVEAHIRSIRKKIEFKGQKKLIHNISGWGYKIDLKK